MSKIPSTAENILDTMLQLAAYKGWEATRLQDVADTLDIGLEDIRQHYRQKDDIAEALFDRADQQALLTAQQSGFSQLPGSDRLHTIIFCWLQTLSPHKSAVIDIFKYKLEPGHIHFQTLGVLRVSRTVQWFLEAADSNTANMSRVIEEIMVTSIYLTSLVYWLKDTSEDSQKTARFIDALLRRSASIAKRINPASVISQMAVT